MESWRKELYEKNELYHHGILGQKWGTRNGPPYPLTPSISNRIRARANGRLRTARAVGREIASAKSTYDKISASVGVKRSAVEARERSKTEKELMDLSRTKLGKAIHERNSKNNQYLAEYLDTVYKSRREGTDLLAGTFFDADFWKMPFAGLSGRTSTLGKEFVLDVLTYNTYTPIADLVYSINKKKTLRNGN